MSGMRCITSVAVLLLATGVQPLRAQAYEPYLEEGEEIEAQVDGDLNGDRRPDSAYVIRTEDNRRLYIVLSYATEVDIGFEAPEELELDPYPLGPADMAISRGVLVFKDLTGGTTAIASTRRYRFDKDGGHMRLIGLDATLYSRTYAHDGFELSWNYLTGDVITRELHLNTKGGDAAYDPIVEKKLKRPLPKFWLEDSPDPEQLIAELSGVGGD